jgi:Na+-transporting methylmalonyl-CoA/oxaloacetate decarboxylase beta subunit
MNRKKLKKIAPIMTILTGAFLLLYVVLRVLIIWHIQADEIAIIGGADAPTAQFLLQKLGWRYILQIVVGIVCIVSGIIEMKQGGRHD